LDGYDHDTHILRPPLGAYGDTNEALITRMNQGQRPGYTAIGSSKYEVVLPSQSADTVMKGGTYILETNCKPFQQVASQPNEAISMGA